jgi:hypothetical protein
VTAAGGPGRRRWGPGVAAWALWGLAVVGVATLPWFDHLLRRAGRPELTQLAASTVPAGPSASSCVGWRSRPP